jgi:EpsI family protein
MKELTLIKTESWIKVAVYFFLLLPLFYSSHSFMVRRWAHEDYNYAYLIPLIVLYLIWEKRVDLANEKGSSSWFAFLPFSFGIFLFFLGELGGEFTTMQFSSWFVFFGLLMMHLGWRKTKIILFPVIFLFGMFTPPNFIQANLTLKLKLISSQIGVAMLQWYGTSAYREGNVIDLGFTQLQVVDACSGLRYLFPLLIMAILLAYFFKAALWKKAVLVLSAVPLTIFTNSLRIAATGVLFEIWGPVVAEDFFHGFSGWLIFIFGLAVLLLEMWVLRLLPGEKEKRKFNWLDSFNWFNSFRTQKSTDPTESTNQTNPTNLANTTVPISSKQTDPTTSAKETFSGQSTKPIGQAADGWKALLRPPQFVVAVLLLTATLAAAQGIEFREKVQAAKSFTEFPMQVGEWSGKRDMMEQRFIDTLDLSDYVIVDYANGSKGVNVYTAYYESQRKGESIHSPETCLPGSGWEFKNAGSVTLPLKSRDGKPMRVNKALMEKGASKQLSYFWFPQRDRVLTNAWELKWYNFWDALTRQRTDGALVRLITPVYPNESVEDADKRLVGFTKEIVPVLNEFLPK